MALSGFPVEVQKGIYRGNGIQGSGDVIYLGVTICRRLFLKLINLVF